MTFSFIELQEALKEEYNMDSIVEPLIQKHPNTMSTVVQMNTEKPTGLIAEGSVFSYYYNGKYYEVEEIGGFLVTMAHLNFEEAKALYEALEWTEIRSPKQKFISKMIMQYRNQELNQQNLMWAYTEKLEAEYLA